MAARGHVRALIPQGKPDTAGGCVRASGRALLAPRARSAPLAVRCPRRRLSRAATGIRGTAAGQAVALRGVLALRCGAACPFCGWPGLRAVPAAAALPPLPSGASPPRRRFAGRAALRLVARVRRGGRALPARAVRARLRGLRSSPPPRSSRPCGAAPLRRVPPVRRPAVPAAFPGGGAASGRSGRAGGGVRGLRPLLPGCAPARFGPCHAACGLWRPSGGVGLSPISPPPLAPAGGQGERVAFSPARAVRRLLPLRRGRKKSTHAPLSAPPASDHCSAPSRVSRAEAARERLRP